MKAIKSVLKAVGFWAVFVALFFLIQAMVTPVWEWPEDAERTRRAVAGIYMEPNNSLDVLWLGTSHMQFGISPMTVYEKTGIRSYNLATSCQTLEMSYERLKAALKNQTPRIVVLDVSALFFDEASNQSNTHWRRYIDSIPWTRFSDKWNAVVKYSQVTDAGFFKRIENLFSFFAFHTNMDIGKHYLTADYGIPYFQKGHVPGTRVASANNDGYWGSLEEMSEEYNKRAISSNVAAKYVIDYRRRLEDNMEALTKIKKLCNENNAELILTKIPLHKSYFYESWWNDEKHALVQEVANELCAPFVDLDDMELIDWKVDTIDAGAHVNEKGAIKISNFWTYWLLNVHQFEPCPNEKYDVEWNKQLEIYRQDEDYLLMQTETDFETYFKMIQKDKFTLFVAVADTIGTKWSEDMQRSYEELTGASLTLFDTYQTAYLCVSQSGVAINEKIDKLSCKVSGTIDGKTYEVKSRGWYEGSVASVVIDGVEFACNSRSMNIVVYDNELHCVVDSVVFDFQVENAPGKHLNNAYVNEFREAQLDRDVSFYKDK